MKKEELKGSMEYLKFKLFLLLKVAGLSGFTFAAFYTIFIAHISSSLWYVNVGVLLLAAVAMLKVLEIVLSTMIWEEKRFKAFLKYRGVAG